MPHFANSDTQPRVSTIFSHSGSYDGAENELVESSAAGTEITKKIGAPVEAVGMTSGGLRRC